MFDAEAVDPGISNVQADPTASVRETGTCDTALMNIRFTGINNQMPEMVQLATAKATVTFNPTRAEITFP